MKIIKKVIYMNCLFLLSNNYPYSGACTSLLVNMFYKGNLLNGVSSVSVLACKGDLIPAKEESINGVNVYNCTFCSYTSIEMCKKALKKHPFRTIKAVAKKVAMKLDSNEIKSCNSRSVYTALKHINAKEYDVIVAVMGSFEIAAAAMKYKKKNPDVKLVIYQVDPCSTNEACSASTRREREAFEKELYDVSDAIITTPILLEESKRVYNEEILCKMHPMEFPNVVPCDNANREESQGVRCIFTGNIYGNIRDPRYTLRLFDEVNSEISFEMIGALNPDTKEEIKSHNVLWNGPKSLEETREEIKKADVLVNIGNKMLNQVPSKLFEYISYGKPIVNICKNRNCPTIPYLEKYKYAINLFEEDDIFEEQVKKLNDFIVSNHNKRMTADEITTAFEACTPQYCAQQMLDVFENI